MNNYNVALDKFIQSGHCVYQKVQSLMNHVLVRVAHLFFMSSKYSKFSLLEIQLATDWTTWARLPWQIITSGNPLLLTQLWMNLKMSYQGSTLVTYVPLTLNLLPSHATQVNYPCKQVSIIGQQVGKVYLQVTNLQVTLYPCRSGSQLALEQSGLSNPLIIGSVHLVSTALYCLEYVYL